MSAKINGPRGAPDALPPDSELLAQVEAQARDLFERYGYRRLDTPIFEHTEVFIKGVGESSDVVRKEMYVFEDRSGRSLVLRPEGTAAVARAYVEHKLYGEPSPQKFFYIGPMFRYERPQKGRTRQFIQMGPEHFGSAEPIADAEVIAWGNDFYASLGLEPELLLNSMGCREDRAAYGPALKAALEPRRAEMCEDCHVRLDTNPMRVFDCKVPSCGEILKTVEPITSYLCEACRTHFDGVKRLLEAAEIKWVDAPSLVRGFDYYTRTVFEFDLASLGARSAVGGGGRYDYLVEQFGGPPTPAVGMAVGVEPTMVALRERGVTKAWTPDVYVAWLAPELETHAMRLGTRLRRDGLKVAINDTSRAAKRQFAEANRLGAAKVYVLGSDEVARNVVTVKDMTSGEQSEETL